MADWKRSNAPTRTDTLPPPNRSLRQLHAFRQTHVWPKAGGGTAASAQCAEPVKPLVGPASAAKGEDLAVVGEVVKPPPALPASPAGPPAPAPPTRLHFQSKVAPLQVQRALGRHFRPGGPRGDPGGGGGRVWGWVAHPPVQKDPIIVIPKVAAGLQTDPPEARPPGRHRRQPPPPLLGRCYSEACLQSPPPLSPLPPSPTPPLSPPEGPRAGPAPLHRRTRASRVPWRLAPARPVRRRPRGSPPPRAGLGVPGLPE